MSCSSPSQIEQTPTNSAAFCARKVLGLITGLQGEPKGRLRHQLALAKAIKNVYKFSGAVLESILSSLKEQPERISSLDPKGKRLIRQCCPAAAGSSPAAGRRDQGRLR